jgi:hypothetical protein
VRKSTEAFQRAFHTVYWGDFHDYDSAMAITGGERQLWTYLLSFYDQVGVLLRRRLIEFDLADDLLGNSTRQLWEKVAPMIREARERYDPRLYEHFEFLYDEMTRVPCLFSPPSRQRDGRRRRLPERLKARR